jgi:hypothetical protein
VAIQDGLGVLADPGFGGGITFVVEGPGRLPEVLQDSAADGPSIPACGPSLNLRLKTSSTVQTGIDALVGTVTAWSAT